VALAAHAASLTAAHSHYELAMRTVFADSKQHIRRLTLEACVPAHMTCAQVREAERSRSGSIQTTALEFDCKHCRAR
jgi:hypothetical protein